MKKGNIIGATVGAVIGSVTGWFAGGAVTKRAEARKAMAAEQTAVTTTAPAPTTTSAS